jgi:type III pantothenate kinase
MILTIDLGNTRIKSAVFENNTLVDAKAFEYEFFFSEIENILANYPKISVLVAASVGKLDISAFDSFSKKLKLHFIQRESLFPFQNKYETPSTLGIDRMVLAAGAVLQYPNLNRLIIDVGTCVTYDYINQENDYLGGAISPGIKLRYEAMHTFTAKLPLLQKEDPVNIVGNSTHQAMHSGVVNGLVFEMEGFINSISAQNENFIIILTGGDAIFLAKRFKNTIFANSNFLLESLNYLYQYQINND